MLTLYIKTLLLPVFSLLIQFTIAYVDLYSAAPTEHTIVNCNCPG